MFLSFQSFHHRRELLQRGLHVVDDFLVQGIRIGQIIGIFQTLILEPENVFCIDRLLDEYTKNAVTSM